MEELLVSDHELTVAFDDEITKMAEANYAADELIPSLEGLISAFVRDNGKLYEYIRATVASAVRMRSKILYGNENVYTDEFTMVFIKKQQDYGPYNIAKFGEAGIIVRLSDKLERMKHLLKKGIKPNNESLTDTVIDIANYCVILKLVLDDRWQVKCNHYKLKIEE